MLIKTKAKSAIKMLITLILTLALIMGIYFAIPKQNTKVSAATTGSSAVLKGYTSVTYNGDNTISLQDSTWRSNLSSPITKLNIVSIRITTDSSKISGFTQGANVKDSSSTNDLYYYYKSAGYQVDTDGDGTVDTDGYDIVIYADVEKIYAPEYCYELFMELINCKSITFDNFDTSNVTDMRGMFCRCYSLISLDLSSFDTSDVINMFQMFVGCPSLTTLDISSFSFASITSADNIELMLGMGYGQFAQMIAQASEGFDVDAFLNADNEGKIQMIIDAGVVSSEYAPLLLKQYGEPSKIIAPTNLNNLEIALPTTYNYTDASGLAQTTSTLVAGATHTLSGYVDDPAPSTGVISDSILISLIALCFVFSGFMLLKKKKVR